ncbi:MAG: Rossmann fold domain-containing protein [Pseudomonadota bacterium]
MQAVYKIEMLPERSLASTAIFHETQLKGLAEQIAKPETTELAIVMPLAPSDHDDWRRTLARDLAREHAPKRVNVIAVNDDRIEKELLAYLRDAPGVTGQYLAAHE